jgi:hypothetical protein
VVTLVIPRPRSLLAPSTDLARPSRAVAPQTTRRGDGHVSQDRRAQPDVPLGPSGATNGASAAGTPGATSSLLWCAILIGLLVYCAQELRRHRIRVLPARSLLAISLHPRPG